MEPSLIEIILIAVLAVPVAVLGVYRLARVIIYDDFPPTAWMRRIWDRLTTSEYDEVSSWNKLMHCPWCLTPWIMLACIGWFLAGLLIGEPWVVWSWWIFWGWLGLSGLSSMVYLRDEPRGRE